jgi:surface protein
VWENTLTFAGGTFTLGANTYTGLTFQVMRMLRRNDADFRFLSGIIIDRALTAGEKSSLYGYYGLRGFPVTYVSNPTTAKVLVDSATTSMLNKFNSGTTFTTIDTAGWDTSNVTTMASAFFNLPSVTTLDVSNFDTSKVVSMANMFQTNTSQTALDVSSWNTANVTNLTATFQNCPLVTTLDVSNWNTAKVTNLSNTFRETGITSIDLSSFVTDKVTTMQNMFLNCLSLTTVTLAGGSGNPFADSPCTIYNAAFNGTNLNEASIDAILVAIESAGTSSGTFGQTGGTAPSVGTGRPAIDALRARSWTVTVTGGY